MKLALSAAIALALLPLSSFGSQAQSGVEKAIKWLGERVIVLRTTQPRLFVDCTPRRTDAEPESALWIGATGVITKAVARADVPRGFELTFTKDGTGETLMVCNDQLLGFFSELEVAKALVGKSLWTKGLRSLIAGGKEVPLENTSRITVTRVDWLNSGTPIQVFFRTDTGEEGPLTRQHVGQGYADGFDPQFHASPRGGGGPYLRQFYQTDPHVTHKEWPATVWKSIQAGEVTVGMTLQMAVVACGQLESEGVVVGTDIKSGGLYRCAFNHMFFKTIEVIDGKVTRLIDR